MNGSMPKVMVVALLGTVVGLVFGLLIGWVIWPVRYYDTDISDLRLVHKNDFIVMVSAGYALDKDLDRARARLAELGERDIEPTVAALAHQYINSREDPVAAQSLAILAEGLGVGDEVLRTYVATATPTVTPTGTPTSTPTPTSPPPSPTGTSTSTPTPSPSPQSSWVAPKNPVAKPTKRPPTATPLPVVTGPAPAEWDPRLDQLEVTWEPAADISGQVYWRLLRARWANPQESAGNLNIFIEVLNSSGHRISGQRVVVENGGRFVLVTRVRQAPEWPADFPMRGHLGSYTAYVEGVSDKIVGMGLGTAEEPGRSYHTSFYLTFQQAVMP
ncbi:MAG: hypothetical protein ACE5NP_11280 [Anaerolineae bacterium]